MWSVTWNPIGPAASEHSPSGRKTEIIRPWFLGFSEGLHGKCQDWTTFNGRTFHSWLSIILTTWEEWLIGLLEKMRRDIILFSALSGINKNPCNVVLFPLLFWASFCLAESTWVEQSWSGWKPDLLSLLCSRQISWRREVGSTYERLVRSKISTFSFSRECPVGF